MIDAVTLKLIGEWAELFAADAESAEFNSVVNKLTMRKYADISRSMENKALVLGYQLPKNRDRLDKPYIKRLSDAYSRGYAEMLEEERQDVIGYLISIKNSAHESDDAENLNRIDALIELIQSVVLPVQESPKLQGQSAANIEES